VGVSSSVLYETFRKSIKVLRLLREGKFRYALRRGVAAGIEHTGALTPLNIRTLVDVGANVGQFSLLAWSLFPQARIYAFEPQLQPAERFSRIFPQDARVTLHRSAVGSRSGLAEMHVSSRNDSSSLLPISQAMPDVFPGTQEVAVTDVSIAPLSAFLTPADIIGPALLKIDVQGGELDVLVGSESLLDRFQYVYVELSFIELYTGQALCHEVVTHLRDRSFQLKSVHNLHEDTNGRAIQADFLFARPDHGRAANSGSGTA
jgi:FkbM family methyltransferase